MRLLFAALVALSVTGSALAQQSAPSPEQSPPPSATAPADQQNPPAAGQPPGRQPNVRRTACVDRARQQGLRAQQLRDSVQLCMEEARLACTKKAIEQKIPAAQRREFMRNCAG